MGFFVESTLVKNTGEVIHKTPRCGLCRLHKRCESPKMEPTGKGKRKILIVGEAPGKTEDERGKQFVGKSGRYLKEALASVGIDMRRDCILENSLRCRPPGNETPTNEQISYCYPNVRETIEQYNPDVILTVGRAGLQSVLTGIWTESLGAMGRWVGWSIPCRSFNCWIVPTYHPSFVIRELEQTKGKSAVEAIYKQHLKISKNLDGPPFKKVVDLRDKIEILYDDEKVAESLDKFRRKGGPIAFDYETNMLKPDHSEADIVSISVCWRGKRTLSFPWRGGLTRLAWKQLLESDSPKIAHGIKFEDRWSKRIGIQPKNFVWCSMTNAHIINCYPEISSLEFQSFVLLGVEPYSKHISQFLGDADGSYGLNKINRIEMNDLLMYGGLDSLTCYMVANKQREMLNLPKL